MTRLACVFGLLAIAALVPLLLRLDGGTAIIFAFVGMPALGLALFLYGVDRWRAGSFRVDRP
jgi:hypothetical protein